MIELRLGELLDCLQSEVNVRLHNFKTLDNYRDLVINNFLHDTRSCKKNIDDSNNSNKRYSTVNIYIAIEGSNFDGHNYIDQCVNLGIEIALVAINKINHGSSLPQIGVPDTRRALGIIASFLYSKWNKPSVCITGSNGKTSTKFILADLLAVKDKVLFSKASYNNDLGVPFTMFNATNDQWAAVFEMGTNHPGEIGYLASIIKTDIAILTCIANTHIGNFDGIDAIAHEKLDIFSNLKENGTAIYPSDLRKNTLWNDLINKQLVKYNKINQITFGFDSSASVWASEIKIFDTKATFTLNLNYQNYNHTMFIELPLLGKHQISNALAAIAAALTLGLDVDDIKTRLEQIVNVDKRMQLTKVDEHLSIIDDSYNASSTSVSAALEYLSCLPGKKIFILGDLAELGNELYANEIHKNIGQEAKKLNIDFLLSFGSYAEASLSEFYDSDHNNNFNKTFADKAELSNTLFRYLKEQRDSNEHFTVLVKGSNIMAMWEVADDLAKKWHGFEYV